MLLEDGHWSKTELARVTMKDVKPLLVAAGIDWKGRKDVATAAITDVMQNLEPESSPEKAPKQKRKSVEPVEEEEEEEEVVVVEDEEVDDNDPMHDKSTPEWNVLPDSVKQRVMEVVWVKTAGSPWWPGLIYHPTNVSGRLKKDALKCCKSKYLVYFYEGGANPWGYEAFDKCKPFNPDDLGEYGNPTNQKGAPVTAAVRAKWDEAVALAKAEAALGDKWERADWLFDEERHERNAAKKRARAEAKAAVRKKGNSGGGVGGDRSSSLASPRPKAKPTAKKDKVKKRPKFEAEEGEFGASGAGGRAAEGGGDDAGKESSAEDWGKDGEVTEPEEEVVEEDEEESSADDDEEEEFDVGTKPAKKAKVEKKEKKEKPKEKKANFKEKPMEKPKAKAPEPKPPSAAEQLASLRAQLAAAVGIGGGPEAALDGVATAPMDEASLGKLTKALKQLWKWPMTSAELPLAQGAGLIKLLKAVKKKHPDGRGKQQASALFDKWVALAEMPATVATAATAPAKAVAAAVAAVVAAPAAPKAEAPKPERPKPDAPKPEVAVPALAEGKAEFFSPAATLAEHPAPTIAAIAPEAAPAASAPVQARDAAAPAPATAAAAPVAVEGEAKGIDAKLREKVRAALRKKDVVRGVLERARVAWSREGTRAAHAHAVEVRAPVDTLAIFVIASLSLSLSPPPSLSLLRLFFSPRPPARWTPWRVCCLRRAPTTGPSSRS